MGTLAQRLAALAAIASLAGACELATHAFDYQVAPALALGVCDACPGASADLRRPPCPPGGGGGDQGRRVFAARRAHLGRPGAWSGASAAAFDLGFDLDCSTRPHGGLPALCAPHAPEAGPVIGWEALPHGIDNAWLQRVLAPLYQQAPPASAFDLDAAVSAGLEDGRFGLLVVVDRWNGEPDDPDVEVSVRSSPGLASGAAPRWDGADVWSPFPEVEPDGSRSFRVLRAAAYVRSGVLVVDDHARGAAVYGFGAPATRFELVLARVSFAGSIARHGLGRFTMSGLVDLPSARAAAPGIAHAITGCAAATEPPIGAMVPSLIEGAADMPMDPASSPTDPCDAISFGWSFDAEPARLGAAGDGADGGNGIGGGCP